MATAARATDPTPDPDELAAGDRRHPGFGIRIRIDSTARKTWWDFTVDVDGPAENPVGTDHTFTLTVRYSEGGPGGFQPVSPGTTLTYSWSGPTGIGRGHDAEHCDPADGPGTTGQGQCTVVIASPTVPGTGTLTITGIDSTTIPEPTRTISSRSRRWATTEDVDRVPGADQCQVRQPRRCAASVHDLRAAGSRRRRAASSRCPTVRRWTSRSPIRQARRPIRARPGRPAGVCTVTVELDQPGSVTVTPGAITVRCSTLRRDARARHGADLGVPAYPAH